MRWRTTAAGRSPIATAPFRTVECLELIGGCDGLIPANPPKEALEKRRREANRAIGGDDNDHYHTVANPAKGETPGERGAGPVKPTGYRPGRKSQQRRKKGGPGR